MTTQPNSKSPRAGKAHFLDVLPDPPPAPDAMQQELHTTEIRSILRQRYAGRPDVLVSGEGYVCFDTSVLDQRLVPDCVVAFDVDAEAIHWRNGYVINDVGKPPDLVLEVASKSTGPADYTRKREGCATFGISEYWRFDPTGGEYHEQALAGDLLVNGTYQPLPLQHGPGGLVWGRSPSLALDLCWDNGRLRFYDPTIGEYLRSLGEAEAERDAAQVRAAEAEAELQRLRQQLESQPE